MAIGDGLKALVLEDDSAVQGLIVKVLQAHGFQVDVASDGLEGLMKIETSLPDIILCDMMMPNLDGLTFTKAIKNHPSSKDVPVIFVTAKTDVESVIEGMKAGAAHYLSKPFRRDDLVEKLKRALKPKT